MLLNKKVLIKIIKEEVRRGLREEEEFGDSQGDADLSSNLMSDRSIEAFAGDEKYTLLPHLIRLTLGNPDTEHRVLGMMIGVGPHNTDDQILLHRNANLVIRQKIAATTKEFTTMKHAVYGSGVDAWIDKAADPEVLEALKDNKTPLSPDPDGRGGLMSDEIFENEKQKGQRRYDKQKKPWFGR